MQSWAARRARTTIVYAVCGALRRRVAEELPGEHYAVRSGAGTSGAENFGLAHDGSPEYDENAW